MESMISYSRVWTVTGGAHERQDNSSWWIEVNESNRIMLSWKKENRNEGEQIAKQTGE